MRPGALIASRFELQSLAGKGAMGVVFRAMDKLTGEIVALKHVRTESSLETERFAREARVLSELRHPAIVRYVAHGRTPEGEAWLAMEWIEGEDLARRLDRAALTVRESLVVLLRVAEALGAAHARGVVHRDIKPANIFLPRGELASARVLDFGIARATGDALRLVTRTGAALGTPGYMAPEQARGDRAIDARADVFALGCVLYECIAGKPAFEGTTVLALLARVLLEDPPRLASAASVPSSVDELVFEMMSKDAKDRPADGEAVAARLKALLREESLDLPPIAPSARRPALGLRERALFSVVLVAPGSSSSSASADDLGAPTLAADSSWALDAARAAAAPYRARMEPLAGGAVLALVTGSSVATDIAARAAQCALALRDALPRAGLSLATGRGDDSGRVLLGEVMERAARGVVDARAGAVRLDEVTLGLLGGRFDVGGDDHGLELLRERAAPALIRTVLGRETPCVGRERELGTLAALYDECVAEQAPRVAIVTGPSGIGKSRLRYELQRKLTGHAEPPQVWMSKGDEMSKGSTYGLLIPAVRETAGLRDDEPPALKCQKLRARVARHVPEAIRERVGIFLGELVGARFDVDDYAPLETARRDPMVLGDQVRRAWQDWVEAEAGAGPLLIILEDLHWGDLPSVQLIDLALQNVRDRPWMVLAFARPEVEDLFPSLWKRRGAMELPLGELSPRASERLVRAVFGDAMEAPTVKRMVERAGGHALYLEEMIRAHAAGRGDDVPESVLAMATARIAELPDPARRVLRAASVFGERFWPSAVTALLGRVERTAEMREWLAVLCDQEVVVDVGEGRFAGEREHVFRHAVAREAAYGMLEEEDRLLGHRLAASWLEGRSEADPMAVAEHWEKSGDKGRAVACYRRGAREAFEGKDLAAAIARGERGLACGAQGEDRAELLVLVASAAAWHGKQARACEAAMEALACAARGDRFWCVAASRAVVAAGNLGRAETAKEIAELLVTVAAEVAPLPELAIGLSRVSAYCRSYDEPDLADRATAAAERVAGALPRSNHAVAGYVSRAKAMAALFKGDPYLFTKLTQEAAERIRLAGDESAALHELGNVAYGQALLGRYEDAELTLRETLSSAARLGLSLVEAASLHNLGDVLSRLGRNDEARVAERDALARYLEQGDLRMVAATRLYLGKIEARAGDLDAAERELREASSNDRIPPGLRAAVLGALADVVLARGHVADALALASEANAILDVGVPENGAAAVRLVYAEALRASGDHERARAAISVARDALLEMIARVSDEGARRSLEERVDEHQRTMELAKAWASG